MPRPAFHRSTWLPVGVLVITLLAAGPVRSAEPWSCSLGPDYPPCIGVDPNYDCGVADICLSANGNQPGGTVIVEAGGTITVKVCLYSDYWCASPLHLTCTGALPEVIVNGEVVTGFTELDERLWDGSGWRAHPIMNVWIPSYSEKQESTVIFTLDPCFRGERHQDEQGEWRQPYVVLGHTSLWWEYVYFEVFSPPYVLWTDVDTHSSWVPGDDGRLVNVYLPFGSLNVPECKSFPAGTVVQLEATPDPGYCVYFWKGTDNDDTQALTNTVTMDGHRDVGLSFYGGNNCRNAPRSSSSPGCGTAAALLGSAMLFGLVWARRGDKRNPPPRRT